ncbi:MAG TPA: transglycosylase domain-containing protein [Polyangiaceae bacterium LLY-WYZ-15_(1-7)]|nr:hypothetical protein [Sandaracinus sp.]HJL05168.1 transglycosylase domain-containing protein [Polyangiaceae bacterium LLY-WYZ-15_(1-7)]MBJ71816.1 hypothetical protein [Sandaracinus sp.]HJL13019.1 transglycosylase domain-containing protein [Polyangiaceae bacterium LLY-WYZ-15_(1-7)]HJL23119.1 transglycosylase domain-containing protein [Polyangiaceae bacterium LLY-WYZ-15_(1-7)]
MSADLGDVSLRWGGVSLAELRAEGSGLDLEAEHIAVDGSLFSLALDGGAAIEAVRVDGLAVELNGSEDLGALMPRGGGESNDDSSGEPQAGLGFELEIRSGQVLLRDAEGELARSSLGAQVGSSWQLRGGDARVGVEGDGDSLAVTSWAMTLERRPWRVAELEASGGRLRVGERRGQVLARLQGLLAKLRGGEPEVEAEAEDESVPPWLARWVDGGSVHLEDWAALPAEEGAAPLVRDLRLDATREGERVHLVGETAAQDGEASWDFRVTPAEARGQGTLRVRQLPFALFVPFLPDLPWWRPEHARLDAELTMEAESPAEIVAHGRLGVRDLGFFHERLAPHPVRGLEATVSGRARWRPAERRLTLEEGAVAVGEARAELEGELEGDAETYRVALRAQLPPTSCEDAVHALPRDLLAETADFHWRGRIGGRLRFAIDSEQLDETELRVRVADGCEFLAVPAMADLRRVQAPFLHRVQEPDGTVFEMTTGPGSANWVSIYGISPFLVQAVVGHEDAAFFRHGGFAVYSIRDALVRNIRAGRYVQGASTITMQLAKNLFLHREKTIARKVQEAILTWWLETALEKAEILELYLNVIEYGPAVYGIVHAADYYFGRAPAELSPAESAFLAVILPNPKRYHESYERGELTRSMRNRVTRFLRHMHARERIDAEALAHGLAQLEDFRFHRPGEPVQARTLQGRAADLPFASGVPGLWGPGGEPLDDMGEGEGEGAEREAVEVEPSGAERRLAP